MQSSPLFSFVMPAYKAGFLKESVDSILGQTYGNLELIVVDDCSPEPICEVVKGYDDNRLTYYSNGENIGGKDLVAQWNKCLSYAKGEWVVMATDDDVYEPDFLETFVKMSLDYPGVDLFRGRICWINAFDEITDIERCYENYLTPVHFFYEMMDGMRGGIPQYIFRREKLIEKGGFVNFPLAWGSDDATAISMSENGVLMSEKQLVSFRWSGQNISTNGKYGGEKVKARIKYSKWMLEHKPAKCGSDKIEQFYFCEIENRLLIMLKVHLIDTILFLPYWKRLVHLSMWLKMMDYFENREKLSLCFRILRVLR